MIGDLFDPTNALGSSGFLQANEITGYKVAEEDPTPAQIAANDDGSISNQILGNALKFYRRAASWKRSSFRSRRAMHR